MFLYIHFILHAGFWFQPIVSVIILYFRWIYVKSFKQDHDDLKLTLNFRYWLSTYDVNSSKTCNTLFYIVLYQIYTLKNLPLSGLQFFLFHLDVHWGILSYSLLVSLLVWSPKKTIFLKIYFKSLCYLWKQRFWCPFFLLHHLFKSWITAVCWVHFLEKDLKSNYYKWCPNFIY